MTEAATSASAASAEKTTYNARIGSRRQKNSGIPSFDAEALAIVERAQPFPMPPAKLDEERFRFIIPLNFRSRPPSQIPNVDIGPENTALDAKMRSICRGC